MQFFGLLKRRHVTDVVSHWFKLYSQVNLPVLFCSYGIICRWNLVSLLTLGLKCCRVALRRRTIIAREQFRTQWDRCAHPLNRRERSAEVNVLERCRLEFVLVIPFRYRASGPATLDRRIAGDMRLSSAKFHSRPPTDRQTDRLS